MFRIHPSQRYRRAKNSEKSVIPKKKREYQFSPRKTIIIPQQCPNATVAVIFLLLIVGASFTEVSANINILQTRGPKTPKSKPQNSDSTILIKNKIMNICTANTLKPTNKAPDVRIDYFKDMDIPVSCVADYKKRNKPTSQCSLEVKKQEKSKREQGKLLQTLKQSIGENEKKQQNELLSFAMATEKLSNSLTKQQKPEYEKILKKMARLRLIASAHLYTNRVGIGDCLHQSRHDLFELLNLEENFKIQIVHGWQTETNAPDHYFILVDSNIADGIFINNMRSAKSYLKNLTQGYICDNWNNGYFEEASNNKLAIYFTYWENLEISTLDLNFDFQNLPIVLTKLLLEELKIVGFTPNSKAAISFFTRPVATVQVEEATTPDFSSKREL